MQRVGKLLVKNLLQLVFGGIVVELLVSTCWYIGGTSWTISGTYWNIGGTSRTSDGIIGLLLELAGILVAL